MSPAPGYTGKHRIQPASIGHRVRAAVGDPRFIRTLVPPFTVLALVGCSSIPGLGGDSNRAAPGSPTSTSLAPGDATVIEEPTANGTPATPYTPPVNPRVPTIPPTLPRTTPTPTPAPQPPQADKDLAAQNFDLQRRILQQDALIKSTFPSITNTAKTQSNALDAYIKSSNGELRSLGADLNKQAQELAVMKKEVTQALGSVTKIEVLANEVLRGLLPPGSAVPQTQDVLPSIPTTPSASPTPAAPKPTTPTQQVPKPQTKGTPSAAPTFRVSCTSKAKGGDGVNTPFTTAADLANKKFPAGSRVRFESNCTFKGPFTIADAASPTNPVRVLAYGTGNPPRITSPSPSIPPLTYNPQHVKVEGMNLTQSLGGPTLGR